jgi:hypothetical protein
MKKLQSAHRRSIPPAQTACVAKAGRSNNLVSAMAAAVTGAMFLLN